MVAGLVREGFKPALDIVFFPFHPFLLSRYLYLVLCVNGMSRVAV